MKRRLTLILILTAAVVILVGGLYWYHARQKTWRLLARAELAIQAENYSKAVELAAASIARNPNNWQGHYVLAKAHMHLGHYDEARGILQHVKNNADTFQPNLPEVMILLAETHSLPARQTLTSTGRQISSEAIKQVIDQLRQANLIFSQVDTREEALDLDAKQALGLNESQIAGLLKIMAERIENEARIVESTGLRQSHEDRMQQSQTARAEQKEAQRHAAQVLLDVVTRDPAREEAAAVLVQLCLDRNDRESLKKARDAIMPAPKTSPIAKMMLIMDELKVSSGVSTPDAFEPIPDSPQIQHTVQQIDELLKQYPEDIQVKLKRAELALLLSDWTTVDRLVEEVLKQNPRQGQARLMKAKRLLMQGEASEPEKLLFTLKAEFPNWPEAHYAYGQAAFAGGKRELARQAMRTVTELLPEHPQARRFLAETLLEDGFYDQAFVDAQAYYRSSPQDPQAILLFVKSCYYQEQHNLALEALEKAAAERPDDPLVMMAVAEGYSILGENAKMMDIARKIAAMQPTANLKYRFAVARAMLLTGRSVEAENILSEELAKYPNHPELNFELGNIYAADGRNLQALERYQKALDHNIKNDQYRLSLAQLLLKIGYLEDCQEILSHFVTPDPRADLMRVQLKLLQGQPLTSEEMVQISESQNKTGLSLALTALHAGKPQQCAALCKTALEKSPDDTDVRMLLGQAYLTMNQLEPCAGEWQILVQQSPRNLTHYLRLASVLLKTASPQDVETRLVSIPGSHRDMVDMAMGQLMEKMDRYPDAISRYQRIIENPEFPPDSRIMARLLMAPLLARQGQIEESLRELDYVLENQKAFYSRVCLLKARILAQAKRHQEADVLLSELRTRALEQGNTMTLITIARTYVNLNQPDQALAVCEEYLKLDPQNPQAYLLKASVLKTFGQTAKMVECYRSAIQYQPGNIAIYWRLVEALDAQEDRQSALQVLDELATMGDTARFASLFERGLLFQQWGLPSHALECFEQLISSGFGDSPKILMALGDVFKNMGQAQRAAGVYERIPDYAPEYRSAQMKRVELMNTTEEKLAILNRLQTLYPDQPEIWSKTFNVLLDAGRGGEAVSEFQAYLGRQQASGSAAKMDFPPLEALSRTEDRRSASALTLAAARNTDRKWWKQAAVLLHAGEQTDGLETLFPDPSKADLLDALVALYGSVRTDNLQAAQQWADFAEQIDKSMQTANPSRALLPSRKILIQLALGRTKEAQASLVAMNQPGDLDKTVISELISFSSSSGDKVESLRLLQASLLLDLGFQTLARNTAMEVLQSRPQSQWAAAAAFNAGAGESDLRAIEAGLQPKDCLIAQALNGEVLMLDKKYDQAAEVFRRIAETSNFPVVYRLKQGMALENAGRMEEALAVYRQVRDASPDDPVAANNMAYVVSELYPSDSGRLNEAVEWASAAVKTAPYVKEFFDTYGWILFLQGQSQQACMVLRNTIKHIPQNPEVHYHLGMAEKALGNTDFAKWHFTATEQLGEKTLAEGISLSPAAAKAVRLAKESLAQMEASTKL